MTTHKEALTRITRDDTEHGKEYYLASDVDALLAQPALCKYGQEPKSCTSSPMDCQCAIDATLAQPEQEPVAWMYKGEPSFDGNKWHDTFEVTTSKQVALWKDKAAKPLYTTPPPVPEAHKRTWVGLTEQEAAKCWSTSTVRTWQAIEAKLKEKNT